MPRKYVAKNIPKKYSTELLDQVLKDIRQGTMTAHRAHQLYGIPRMTLYSRLNGTRGKEKGCVRGRATAIPAAEEEKLASALKTMEKWGFGLSRKEVLEVVKLYVESNKMKTPFTDNRPGEDWFLNFKARHRLSIKKPEPLEYVRKKMTDPFVVGEYFDLLEGLLTQYKLHDKPHLIWNLDESSFCSDPSRTKVVGAKNTPSSRITSGGGKDNTTVLAACNADGSKAPPLIIFKAKNVWDEWLAPVGSGYPGTSYTASDNGWITTEIFKNYFKKHLIPALGSERPVLVIYDGHSTHVSPEVIEEALKENVIILKLPPHTTHFLQPLDKAVFRSFKVKWDEKLVTWQRKNLGRKVSKKEFSIMLGQTWLQLSDDVIKSGFEGCGISPFNRDVVPRNKFDPQALERWDRHQQSLRENISDLPTPSTSTQPVPQPGPTILYTSVENSSLASIKNHSSSSKQSFEDLLLNCVKQTPKETSTKKKKKVANGAEVVTTEETLKKIREEAEAAREAEEKKKEKKKRQTAEKNQNKKQKNKAPSPETSDDEMSRISDISLRSENDLPSDPEEWFTALPDDIKEDNDKEVEIGNWVLVRFATKKTIKHHVGKITQFEGLTPIVQFVKKTGENTFVYPHSEDISEIDGNAIVTKLPEPSVGRRGVLIFPVKFSSYNMG